MKAKLNIHLAEFFAITISILVELAVSAVSENLFFSDCIKQHLPYLYKLLTLWYIKPQVLINHKLLQLML